MNWVGLHESIGGKFMKSDRFMFPAADEFGITSNRQRDNKRCPLRLCCINFDSTAVFLNDLLANC